MKNRRRIFGTRLACAVLPLVLSPSLSALDLKPTFIETVLEEGFKRREVMLSDGDSRVIYCPPPGWIVEERERALKFYPPRMSLADFTIEAEPVTSPQPVSNVEMEPYAAWLKRTVPPESTAVEMEAPMRSPVSVADCQTLAVTLAYTSNGNRFRKRVIFVFAPTAVIRCTTVARASDFERFYETARRSLFTWRWEKWKQGRKP